ncbi:hypothetical protein IT412_04455 [Candidatus Peregrinibacteria bacterium]|nr:hypothetical protein [Candidatus Peregrinibacteria bacterium]
MKKTSKWVFGKAKAGISIMLSTIMISVVVLFSVGVTVLVTDSVRQSSNVKQGTTAYYSAEAGLEQALWVNQKLASTGDSIGANEGADTGAIGAASAKFKIQGSTQNLNEKTVNGKYIIPFPWTGNAPWHGEGSIAGSGGCSPEKPPLRSGTGNGKQFNFMFLGTVMTMDEQYHPCNWNVLKLGEKASIPLFSKDSTTGNIHKFTAFTLRVRTPCKEGAEMCGHSDRLTLNCFDKGSAKVKCKAVDTSESEQWKKGDVMMAGEIDGEKVSGGVDSLLPRSKTQYNGYKPIEDAQLFEGRVNDARDAGGIYVSGSSNGDYYEVLNELMTGIINGDTNLESTIADFLSDINLSEPVLKLSVVTELTHCDSKNGLCSDSLDNPASTSTYKKHNVPYLEYQIILPADAASNFPASMNNLITAEGSSGPFNQSIQVKVPNDNSTLEYVIQQ